MWQRFIARMCEPFEMKRGHYAFIMFSFGMVWFTFAASAVTKAVP